MKKSTPFTLRLLLPVILLGFILMISGCGKEKEFMFDLDDLLETPWGIPQIIEPGQGPINMDAPTIFHPDGHVTIGPATTDFWSVRGERSLLLEVSGEIWFIIDLSPNRLYVEKTTHPGGTFIVKCLYEPMKK
ncbi:MAG: hypothetical protein EA361_01310 [Bacteroidetes bacterium]|nr:MAG: hypothetical protein EA361_01310 [Bacteroidota bacterium]